MHVQRILDRTGDTRHVFSPSDVDAVALAERRFKELTGAGFIAFAAKAGGGDSRLLRVFDPDVRETIFTPQRAGG